MTRKYTRKVRDGVPLCVKCHVNMVAFFRDDKGYCAKCDPYHPLYLVKENERLYQLLKHIEAIARDQLPSSYPRGAILRALRKIKGPVPLYSRRVKGVEWQQPRPKKRATAAERKAFRQRMEEGRARKRQLESEFNERLEP